MTKLDKYALVFILVLALCSLWLVFRSWAQAEPRWPEWNPQSSQDLGLCLMAEADMHVKDWPALAHCVVKQWRWQLQGRTIRQQIRRTCKVFDKTGKNYYGKRPDLIRRSTWVKPLYPTNVTTQERESRWKRNRDFVARFQLRKVPDPCPRCMWWAGDTDEVKPEWTCVLGKEQGYANRFCYVQK